MTDSHCDQTAFASRVQAIAAAHGNEPTSTLQILIQVQERFGWISPAAIDCLEHALRLPRTKILAVASFYSFLHTSPTGRYRVLFSDNITDRMQGGPDLMLRMRQALGVEGAQIGAQAGGKASGDGLASIGATSCTGLCDQGPGLLVNGFAIPRATPERIDQICGLIRRQTPLEDWPRELFALEDNVRRVGPLLQADFGPGAALRAGLALGPEGMLEQLKLSGLRGRGGAGFSTAAKWQICRDAPGNAPQPAHYVVCNADEGEPGTFKDRVLLTLHADRVFEGMTLCAAVTGARRGFLYLRGEYRYLLEHLQAVLARRRAQGLLGTAVLGQPGFDFEIEIHLGAGAYICGEESALIESLEGKRGTPRNRPPYPVTHGYLNQPTVVNNVETFLCASLVALHGGAWFAATGTQTSTGSKLLSVSGDCARPGIYEYPFGVTVAQVLADCGAEDTQAVQVSGPAGVCLSTAEFGRRIAFDDVPTAGAFMVFNHTRDMFEVARNFTHFFAHESCGFCTPCRVGTALLADMMDKLGNGQGSPHDFAEIEKLNQHLLKLSHCGLGHSACNPVLDTIAKFRPAYERRLLHREFVPAFDLDRALAPARQLTGRDDPAAHLESMP